MPMKEGGAVFPVVFVLEGKKVIVVGGGMVASRKIASLLESGADVTVVSPAVCDHLMSAVDEGRLKWIRRGYESADVAGAFLVFAATSDAEVNSRVSSDARASSIPVNVADVPGQCDFILPSVLSRGGLRIAVSTGGGCPGFSRRVRLEIEKYILPHTADLLVSLAGLRADLMMCVSDPDARKSIMDSVLYSREFAEALRDVNCTALAALVREKRRIAGCDVGM